MLLFMIFCVVLLGILALARQSRFDVEPKTTLTTYDYVPEWIDCEDIVMEHSRTCDMEDAILNSNNSTEMALNVCYLLNND